MFFNTFHPKKLLFSIQLLWRGNKHSSCFIFDNGSRNRSRDICCYAEVQIMRVASKSADLWSGSVWQGGKLLPPTDVTGLADAACKQRHGREDPQTLLDDTLQVAQLFQVLHSHVAVWRACQSEHRTRSWKHSQTSRCFLDYSRTEQIVLLRTHGRHYAQ